MKTKLTLNELSREITRKMTKDESYYTQRKLFPPASRTPNYIRKVELAVLQSEYSNDILKFALILLENDDLKIKNVLDRVSTQTEITTNGNINLVYKGIKQQTFYDYIQCTLFTLFQFRDEVKKPDTQYRLKNVEYWEENGMLNIKYV